MPPRIAISINTAWNILNFRAGLIRALTKEGYEVIALAPSDVHAECLAAMGVRFIPLPIDSKGVNPLADALLFLRYLRVLRRERPAAFLGYTIKPNVYGSLAAHALGIPVINNVSGLGTAFIRTSWLSSVVKRLYRFTFSRSRTVFFQNEDDRALFVDQGLVRLAKTAVLPGSGIDLHRFKPAGAAADVSHGAGVRFLLIARLLYDKGVGEFVEAACAVKSIRPEATFALLGFLDVDNRTAVRRADMERWVGGGVIEYLGAADDVRPHIASADCIVLPSYREGTPRTLLEGAAMAKPIIASNVPGCREVVDTGENGLLCRAMDADDLAAKMLEIIDMGLPARQAMGAAGRRKMERQYDERLVIDAYLRRIASILKPAAPPVETQRVRTHE